MPKDLTRDEVRTMAADIDLGNLNDEHLEQLVRATRAARSRRGSLRTETLAPADEPAHVFRLAVEIVR